MWPDPKCKAKHKLTDTIRPWQHTPTCRENLKGMIKKARSQADKDYLLEAMEGDGLVERIRESGGL